MTYHTGHAVAHGTSFLASVALLWQAVLAHAPGWSLVPPLLLSAASLVGAFWSARKVAQDLRHADELHRVRLARARLGLPECEPLDRRG